MDAHEPPNSPVLTTTYGRPRKFVSRIGRHHFAHLRAIAQGIEVRKSALLYLGVEHGHEAVTASRQTIDAVRAIARKHGEGGSSWRLIGLTIRPKTHEHLKKVEKGFLKVGQLKQPTVEEYIAERDLQDWSLAEVLEQYKEAYPATSAQLSTANRRDRLRERQLDLLRRLEGLCAELPSAEDLLHGWYDDITAGKLISAGIINLGQLHDVICRGGRWFSCLPGVGVKKAERIKSFLFQLIPPVEPAKLFAFTLALAPSAYTPFRLVAADASLTENHHRTTTTTILRASNDQEAVNAWIAARAGKQLTAKSYQREAVRLMLWLQHERDGISFADMAVEDCLGYMTFLQNIPERWISRRRAAPYEPGWAPFRGQLDHDSHRQAVVIIASMFRWFHSAQYVPANPWVLVNLKTGDDKNKKAKQSKAISDFGFSEILRYIASQPPSPSTHRIEFIFTFLSCVGLRSTEFLEAKLQDFERQPEGWVLSVHGKGSKNRDAFIPDQAFFALQKYLSSRGIGGIETAPPSAPLLANTLDFLSPVGYQAFYEHVQSWTQRAIRASTLPTKERTRLELASPHWLRHTFGAAAVARDVAMDAIQAQMGHASIQTTMNIYGRAPMKRRAEQLGKAFGSSSKGLIHRESSDENAVQSPETNK